MLTATGLALAWLFILLVGADNPPPAGFFWLLPVLCAFAFVVYWRQPTYARLKQLAVRRRWLQVLSEGTFVGLALAFVLHVARLPDLPIRRPTGSDFIAWMLVLAAVGCANACLVYLLAPRGNS